MLNTSKLIYAIDLIQEEQYEKALENLKEIHQAQIKEDLYSIYVIYYIAYSLDRIKKFEEAATFINLANELDPTNLWCKSLASTIYGNLISLIELNIYDKASIQKTIKLYNLCKENGYVNSHLQFVMVRHYLHFNQIQKAKTYLDNALERNPNDRDFLDLRAEIAKKEKDALKLNEIKAILKGNHIKNGCSTKQ